MSDVELNMLIISVLSSPHLVLLASPRLLRSLRGRCRRTTKGDAYERADPALYIVWNGIAVLLAFSFAPFTMSNSGEFPILACLGSHLYVSVGVH